MSNDFHSVLPVENYNQDSMSNKYVRKSNTFEEQWSPGPQQNLQNTVRIMFYYFSLFRR